MPSARNPLTEPFERNWKEEASRFRKWSVRWFRSLRCSGAAHKPIAKHLFSDAGIWLQNLDSHIMNGILMRLMERDILGLPVHDSVIVQREHRGSPSGDNDAGIRGRDGLQAEAAGNYSSRLKRKWSVYQTNKIGRIAHWDRSRKCVAAPPWFGFVRLCFCSCKNVNVVNTVCCFCVLVTNCLP